MDRKDCLMATKAEKLHMQKMVEFGCVVCRWYCEEDDLPPCNIHHIRDHTGMGMKDADMIPLCHTHHQGKIGYTSDRKENMGRSAMEHSVNYINDYMEEL